MDSKLYQRRVFHELDELQKRLKKLESFLEGPILESSDNDEKQLLRIQYQIMGSYKAVLLARINKWSK